MALRRQENTHIAALQAQLDVAESEGLSSVLYPLFGLGSNFVHRCFLAANEQDGGLWERRPAAISDYRGGTPLPQMGEIKTKPKKTILRLYVTGKSLRSTHAVKLMRQICSGEFEEKVSLEIIDVMEYPFLADDDKIFATPAVIRAFPKAPGRIITDFSNRDKVLLGLGLLEPAEPRMR